MNNNPRCEDAPCCGCCPGIEEQEDYREAHEAEIAEQEMRGWPGDGSGEDDLADMNQNEAGDYQNE
jgi:hypothetical protein